MEMQCLRLQTDRNRQHVRQAQSGQNEKLSNAVSPLCKTTHMLPVPVRLWSEHAFHIPPRLPAPPSPASSRACPAAGAPFVRPQKKQRRY